MRCLNRSVLGVVFVGVVLATTPAQAGYPDDLLVDNLAQLEGCTYCVAADLTGNELAALQQDYFTVVAQDLMVLSSPHLVAPAESMGVNGFDVGIEETFLMERKNHPRRANGLLATGWEAMAMSGQPSPVGHAPGVRFRKGLPFSGEVEGTFRYVPNTRQAIVSGHARWSVLDGWPWVPDVALGIGYGGYIGNPQLDVGAMQLDVVAGWTIPVGVPESIYNGYQFSPWFGYAIAIGHAQAKNTSIDLLHPKLTGWADNAESGTDAKDFQFHKIVVGLRIVQHVFQFSASADIVVDDGEGYNTGADTITLRFGLFF